jgi:hypothetical protein
MQSGLVNKIAATSAEVTDAQGLENMCPNSCAVYSDQSAVDESKMPHRVRVISKMRDNAISTVSF